MASAYHEQQKMMFRHTLLEYIFGTATRHDCKPMNIRMTTTIFMQGKINKYSQLVLSEIKILKNKIKEKKGL